jgi:hypothetical protein
MTVLRNHSNLPSIIDSNFLLLFFAELSCLVAADKARSQKKETEKRNWAGAWGSQKVIDFNSFHV